MLPILHLNGYKIAGPTALARSSDDDVRSLLEATGYEPLFVEGADPAHVHQALAAALDQCYAWIRRFQSDARANGTSARYAVAGDRAANAERMDRAARSRWSAH